MRGGVELRDEADPPNVLTLGGNASYFPALLSARVGAEDPRYPRLPCGCRHAGSRGHFFSLAATHLCLGFSGSLLVAAS
jgi:hypothetical protein